MEHVLYVLLIASVFALALSDDHYTTKYDNVDLDTILRNERILKRYVDCCLDKTKCTPEGLELKSHIREFLEIGCVKCSIPQKRAVRKIVKTLHTKHPQWWKELCDYYDPQAQYQKKYEKFIQNILAEAE